MFNFIIFSRSPSTHNRSKALEKSIWIATVMFPECRANSASWRSLTSGSQVDMDFLKPACEGFNSLFVSRYQLSRFTISFSASLQTVLVNAIGLYEFRSFLSLPILRIGLTTENFQLLGISPIHQ